MKTVMAFGTFDVLHRGHEFYLRKAKQLGGCLVVVVARDENVETITGRKPLHSEQQRLGAVKKLSFVDKAVLGDREMRKWGIVKRHAPAVIALGYDQWKSIPSLRKELKGIGLHPEIVRIPAFQQKKYKSSLLKKQFKANEFRSKTAH